MSAQKMFGCSTEMLDLTISNNFRSHDVKMLLTGILSESQEAMARGNLETARQQINQVKYLIDKLEVKRGN
jgi:hypothetical protein